MGEEAGGWADQGGYSRWVVAIVLVALAAQFLVLGLVQAREDAFTYDEPYYAVAGSTALRERDLRINYEHPPLPKVLAAIPAELWGGVEIPLDTGAWDHGDQWNLSLEVYQANLEDIEWVTFLYRIVPTLLAAGVGLLLFLLGQRLFGGAAGLLSAALWLTAPVALGYGHLNGLDVPAAFTVVLTLWLLARYATAGSLGALALVAASVGVALLTRAAVGLVVAGAAFAVVLVVDLYRRDRLAPLRAATVLGVGWAMVWAGYALLDPGELDLTVFDQATQRLLTSEPASLPARLALLVPWPAGFAAGIRFLSDFHSSAESLGYLYGHLFTGAPDWFWLGSFLFKMTLASLVVIAGGLVAWLRLGRDQALRALAVLVPMAAGLVLMMTYAERPFGARYLVPIVVVLLAAAGPVATLATRLAPAPRRLLGAVLALAVLAGSATLWQSHPYTFAWSNPLWREAWQQAADSNVDWGQDFYRLQAWVAEQEEPVWVSYFGNGPSLTLSEMPNAVSAHPYSVWGPMRKPWATVTTYAVSASNLNAFVGEQLGLLRSYCPVELIGQTILVYRFEEPPWGGLSLAGPVDGLPAPLCEGEPFSLPVG